MTMESAFLRASVAAAQTALRTPVKKEENKDETGSKDEKVETKPQLSPDAWYDCFLLAFHQTLGMDVFFVGLFLKASLGKSAKEKTEETTTAKKRKTEWQAALKKFPGDTQFVKACGL